LFVAADDVQAPADDPDAHMVQTDRHGSFRDPAIHRGIVFFDGRSDRKIQHIAQARLFEAAHDVNLACNRCRSDFRPLHGRRCGGAPDAGIVLSLLPEDRQGRHHQTRKHDTVSHGLPSIGSSVSSHNQASNSM
jgi:hypothetical protein